MNAVSYPEYRKFKKGFRTSCIKKTLQQSIKSRFPDQYKKVMKGARIFTNVQGKNFPRCWFLFKAFYDLLLNQTNMFATASQILKTISDIFSAKLPKVVKDKKTELKKNPNFEQWAVDFLRADMIIFRQAFQSGLQNFEKIQQILKRLYILDSNQQPSSSQGRQLAKMVNIFSVDFTDLISGQGPAPEDDEEEEDAAQDQREQKRAMWYQRVQKRALWGSEDEFEFDVGPRIPNTSAANHQDEEAKSASDEEQFSLIHSVQLDLGELNYQQEDSIGQVINELSTRKGSHNSKSE